MMTLADLLLGSVRASPQAVAVYDAERGTQITYEALGGVVQDLAQQLQSLGLGPGDRVGVCAPKTIGTLASLFGIMRAGGAYVPVDVDAPASRNAFIFQDCGVKAIVVALEKAEGLREALAGEAGLGWTVEARLDGLRPYGANLMLVATTPGAPPQESPNGLSYILYTSGSTGRPKGVMHTHASALSFIDWCSETFQPTPEDRFSSHAPFHFDLSILDLYVPLKHGARLVLFGEGIGKQPTRMAQAIADTGITAWYSTPSVLRLLVSHGQLETCDFSALRLVNFAGEVFPMKHFHALKACWPHPAYYNLYGPTETNVCTAYRVPDAVPPERHEPFPIGEACSGDEARVLDDRGRGVPAGTEGELVVAGGSVMAGYWNLPERTKGAFLRDEDGKRWYKTGDLVVETPADGYLFVGRKDRMVKRRGYRVELGEIEAALYLHPDVAEAAVVAVADDEGMVVHAFLAWEGARGSVIAMKRHCVQHLPLYMIPDRFHFDDILPKTSTDKIDYQTLSSRLSMTSA